VTRQGRQHVVENRIRFSTNNLPDPIFGLGKALRMVYSIDGKIGVSIIPEQNREIELLSSDSAAVKLAEVPGERFSLPCAHYGAHENWIDVTETLKGRIKDGTRELSSEGLDDPAFGVLKAIVAIYAWEGKVHVAVVPEGPPASLPDDNDTIPCQSARHILLRECLKPPRGSPSLAFSSKPWPLQCPIASCLRPPIQTERGFPSTNVFSSGSSHLA
jgi:hypothetical protein